MGQLCFAEISVCHGPIKCLVYGFCGHARVKEPFDADADGWLQACLCLCLAHLNAPGKGAQCTARGPQGENWVGSRERIARFIAA